MTAPGWPIARLAAAVDGLEPEEVEAACAHARRLRALERQAATLTDEMVALVREAILRRRGEVIDEPLADERARNVVAALGGIGGGEP